MKNTWGYHIMSYDTKDGNGYRYEFRNFKVFLAYEDYTMQQLHKYDFEQSFTGQFLNAGFESSQKDLRPTINWHGVSVYHPDLILSRGEKQVILSLQGCLTRIDNEIYKRYENLIKDCALKYIRLQDKDDAIYEDWTGNLPPKEMVSEFLK